MNSPAAHIGGMWIARGNRQGPLACLDREICNTPTATGHFLKVLRSVGEFDHAEGRPRVLVLGNGPKSKQLEFPYVMTRMLLRFEGMAHIGR